MTSSSKLKLLHAVTSRKRAMILKPYLTMYARSNSSVNSWIGIQICPIIRSMYTSSMSGEAYKRHPNCHSAMRNKPLQVYDPNAKRSRLQTPELRYNYVNRSEVEIGNRYHYKINFVRSDAYKKHYVTTNTNHIGNFGMTAPCSHPLILAERAKWNHHLKGLWYKYSQKWL